MELQLLSKYIGVPFLDGGRDPAIGLDCWGLFKIVQKELFDIDVPDYKVSCYDTVRITWFAALEIEKNWSPIDRPEPGCAIVMAMEPMMPDVVQHYGVCIGGGKFIHILDKVGVHVSRISNPFYRHKIKGYYRWNKLPLSA